jgi:PAS domain S-box-containing protein
MQEPDVTPTGANARLPGLKRCWSSLMPVSLYAACIAGAALVLCAFMTVQSYLFIGRFEPVFLVMPTIVGTLVGSLIARILTLQRQMKATNVAMRVNQQRDERFRLALRASDYAVWDWKLDENRVFCSQGGRNILGGTGNGEYIPVDWWKSWIHPDDQARFFASMNGHVRGEVDRYECEFRVRHEDGLYRWVVDRAFASRDENGRATRISGVVAEITDRKVAEMAILEAKTEAEQANRAKSEFLANMSHELRTPLNAIIGFSEILKTQIFGPVGSPQYVEYASDIWHSGKHLLDIINDILDLSRIESGKMTLTSERVDLRESATQTLRMVEDAARARDIHIEVALDVTPHFVIGDPRAIRQILLNLLSNSVKFTPDGGLIRLTSRLDANGRISLSVTDTGIGMRPEDIPVALAPFRQIDSSLARKHDGTGLGLPLAKALTELQGGQFSIVSEPGSGTEVAVALPQAERAVAA